jgi:predicted nicotinamide N-methyase
MRSFKMMDHFLQNEGIVDGGVMAMGTCDALVYSRRVVPGYSVTTTTLRIGETDFRIRTLLDRQQFSDPEGKAAALGISSASWPMFGMYWPSGRVLAEVMCRFPIAGKRILEMGCGIGLASLVAKQRGGDITASDHHPLAREFLDHNSDLNHLPRIDFQGASFEGPNPGLGKFDLILGSDILYERQHPAVVSAFLERHMNATSEFLLADPGRGRCGQLSRRLEDQGYAHEEERRPFEPGETAPFKGRIVRYWRSAM